MTSVGWRRAWRMGLRRIPHLATVLLVACHPSSRAHPTSPPVVPPPGASTPTPDGDAEARGRADVPPALRSCLPRVRWIRGERGAWGVGEPLPGPDAQRAWDVGRRCVAKTGWTSIVVDDALGLHDRIADAFARRCAPPRLRTSERMPPEEALSVDAGVRGFLADLGDPASGSADVGQAYAARGRRQRDPLSSVTSDLLGGAPGRVAAARLLVLPMTAGELLGCWLTRETGERDPAADAVLGRWHHRWRGAPYAITAGRLWLHVPNPPRRLGEIASVALEIAHVSPTLRLDGTAQYFVQAASSYWPVDGNAGELVDAARGHHASESMP